MSPEARGGNLGGRSDLLFISDMLLVYFSWSGRSDKRHWPGHKCGFTKDCLWLWGVGLVWVRVRVGGGGLTLPREMYQHCVKKVNYN